MIAHTARAETVGALLRDQPICDNCLAPIDVRGLWRVGLWRVNRLDTLVDEYWCSRCVSENVGKVRFGAARASGFDREK